MVQSPSVWQIVLFVIFFDTKGKDRQPSYVCQPPGGVFVEFIKKDLAGSAWQNFKHWSSARQIFSIPARPGSRLQGGREVR